MAKKTSGAFILIVEGQNDKMGNLIATVESRGYKILLIRDYQKRASIARALSAGDVAETPKRGKLKPRLLQGNNQ